MTVLVLNLIYLYHTYCKQWFTNRYKVSLCVYSFVCYIIIKSAYGAVIGFILLYACLSILYWLMAKCALQLLQLYLHVPRSVSRLLCRKYVFCLKCLSAVLTPVHPLIFWSNEICGLPAIHLVFILTLIISCNRLPLFFSHYTTQTRYFTTLDCVY